MHRLDYKEAILAGIMDSYILYAQDTFTELQQGELTIPAPASNSTKPATNKKTTAALELDTIIDFGKHKGKTVEELCVQFPDYIDWMIKNDVRPLSQEVIDYIKGN